MTRLRLPLLLVLATLLGSGCKPAPVTAPPSPTVLAALQRGINLAVWSAETNLDEVHAAQVNPDDADLARIASLGLRHVRISFDPAWLADGELKARPDRLATLQRDLQRAQSAGLFVVLSLQPSSAFKQRLGREPAHVEATAELWRRVAQALKGLGPQQLAFELLNEPELDDAATVHRVMTRFAAAIRKAAPLHTLVAQGPRFSDIPDLMRLAPLADRNVVYSFHFYEPKNFTHQGVPYGWPMWGLLADLPYPSSPEAVEPALQFMTFEAQEHARYYGEQRWDRTKLAEAIAPVSDWAAKHGVALWCSEFGAFRYKAKPEDRARWLKDTRELLEQRNIGWTLWDYAGYFGLVSGPQGQRVLDRNAAAALGLSQPAAP